MSLHIENDISDEELQKIEFEKITELYFSSKNPVMVTRQFIDCIHKFKNLKILNFRYKNIKFKHNYVFDFNKFISLSQYTDYRKIKENIDDAKEFLELYKDECLQIKRDLKTLFFTEFAKLKIDTLEFDYVNYKHLSLFHPTKIFILDDPLFTFSHIVQIISLLENNGVEMFECKSYFEIYGYDYSATNAYKIYKAGNFKCGNYHYDITYEDSLDIEFYKKGHYTEKEYIYKNPFTAIGCYNFLSGFEWDNTIADEFIKIIDKIKFVKIPFVVRGNRGNDLVIFEPLIYNYENTLYINNKYLKKTENDIAKINPNVQTLYLSDIDTKINIPITVENLIYTGKDEKSIKNLKELTVPFGCSILQKTFESKYYDSKYDVSEDNN